MHVPWAVEGLPTLLHLSLFLFFGGLVIFLFNIDHEVFICVVWWIGLFSMVYGMITLLPIIRHDSPYNSPLFTPVWFLYAGIHYVAFKVLAFIAHRGSWSCWFTILRMRDRYKGWMLGGVEKAVEETASERSSEIDVQILDWTISALGDDDSLKSFFEAISGFFNSKFVNHLEWDFSMELRQKFRDALRGFLGRTWTSNSVNESEKLRRFEMTMNAMSLIPRSGDSLSFILLLILSEYWNEVPQTIEMGHSLAYWCTSSDPSVAQYARVIVARILGSVREREDNWVSLASRVFGLPEWDLWDNIALGDDSVLLAIFIRVTRQYLHSDSDYSYHLILEFSKLDTRNTDPRLQHEFCTLWNEIVQEARNQAPNSIPVFVLHHIRHLYITLHQGTDASPTAFSASTPDYNDILYQPSSYRFCHLASHRPESINSHDPLSPDALSYTQTDADNTASQQFEQAYNIIEPPSSFNSTTTSEIGEASQHPNMTPLANPVHFSSRPTSASPTAAVVTALQDFTPTATLSHPPEGREPQGSDIVAPSAEPVTTQIFSTASTHAPTPKLTPIPTCLPNIPSESYDT